MWVSETLATLLSIMSAWRAAAMAAPACPGGTPGRSSKGVASTRFEHRSDGITGAVRRGRDAV